MDSRNEQAVDKPSTRFRISIKDHNGGSSYGDHNLFTAPDSTESFNLGSSIEEKTKSGGPSKSCMFAHCLLALLLFLALPNSSEASEVLPRLEIPRYLLEGVQSETFSCNSKAGSQVSWSIEYNNGTTISPYNVNHQTVETSEGFQCIHQRSSFTKTFDIDLNDTTLCCNVKYENQTQLQACEQLYILESDYCKDKRFGFKDYPYDDCFLRVFCLFGTQLIDNTCEESNRCFNKETQLCDIVPPQGVGDPYSCSLKPDGFYIPIKDKCRQYAVCQSKLKFNLYCPFGHYFTNNQTSRCSTDLSKASEPCL
ncbi:uncharacterized protein LOC126816293 [Patella vulgata]|uniref:uncharacterized protein LOC126816293 n=1 Tax=Patella vulgata TaxID=6465 RepID=UPI00218080D1|nr:uncharacterized protein LOC126816293 [Patella vulgata]